MARSCLGYQPPFPLTGQREIGLVDRWLWLTSYSPFYVVESIPPHPLLSEHPLI